MPVSMWRRPGWTWLAGRRGPRTLAEGQGDRLLHGVHAELAQDVLDVCPDRLGADLQRLGDLGACLAGGEACQDLRLPAREATDGSFRLLRCVANDLRDAGQRGGRRDR